ncbi:MAG: hypothetical protein A3K30_05450 [Deltaproteobacteria bacterium RBG_13_51_10]|nr:MAG: hypothetical protein A3K30_05450 [Deltaproteobacteria bacterium RBG_13_51_10]
MSLPMDWRGETPPEIEKALEQMREFIIDDARSLAKEFYRDLEKEYEYLTEDKQIIEALNSNDKRFTRDGEEI